MKNHVQLNAETRAQNGKSHARRMRREQDQIPGILYGAGQAAQSISLPVKALTIALAEESTYSRILTLNVSGVDQKVVLKQVQRHPSRPRILHVDFLRVDMNKKLTMEVPVHLHGAQDAPGIKDGGILSHHLTEVEIQCLPADLPEFIELDISNLGLGESLHLSHLPLPKGVELTVDAEDEAHNQPVVSIVVPHTPTAEELAGETAAPEAPVTEVIGEAERAAAAEEEAKAAAASPEKKKS